MYKKTVYKPKKSYHPRTVTKPSTIYFDRYCKSKDVESFVSMAHEYKIKNDTLCEIVEFLNKERIVIRFRIERVYSDKCVSIEICEMVGKENENLELFSEYYPVRPKEYTDATYTGEYDFCRVYSYNEKNTIDDEDPYRDRDSYSVETITHYKNAIYYKKIEEFLI